jgi:hypothetical protein
MDRLDPFFAFLLTLDFCTTRPPNRPFRGGSASVSQCLFSEDVALRTILKTAWNSALHRSGALFADPRYPRRTLGRLCTYRLQ